MGDHFYNTAHLAGAELRSAIEKAKTQEEVIILLFNNSNAKQATPSQVLRAVRKYGKRWPITSVRRAMHSLTKDKRLVKTDHQQAGPEGMPEHIWRLASPQPEQSQ